MDQTLVPETAANCSPVFSMAGVMPAASEMAGWKTANPNPDARISGRRPAGHGLSLSIAGVMPGRSETTWRTAMPNPVVDVLDAEGYAITRIEAETRAEAQLARQAKSLESGHPKTTTVALERAS